MSTTYSENDFETEKYRVFEEKFGKVRNLGKILILLLITAGLAGIFGYGIWTKKTLTLNDNAQMEYECFLRERKETPLKINLNNKDHSSASIVIPSRYLKKVGIKSILPVPTEVVSGEDSILFRFKTKGSENISITFNTYPIKAGNVELNLTVNGEPASVTQFIYP